VLATIERNQYGQPSMSNPGDSEANEPSLVNVRSMDIIVALLMFGLSVVFMLDSWRIGIGWAEGTGPAAGFFPFYVCLVMALSSIVVLVQAAVAAGPDGAESFVSKRAMMRVLLVLIPTALYVLAIQFLGIYVSSALFIAGFMLASRDSPLKAILVGAGVPLALFMMFEKWFLVPLPKGPLEAILGLG
jgi:putative tricarboxylic transport membrane protein